MSYATKEQLESLVEYIASQINVLTIGGWSHNNSKLKVLDIGRINSTT